MQRDMDVSLLKLKNPLRKILNYFYKVEYTHIIHSTILNLHPSLQSIVLKIIFPYLLLLDVSQQKAHGTCQSKWAGTRLSVTCGGDSSLLNFLVNIAINNTRTEESSIIRSSLRRVSVPASRTLPLPLPPLTVFIFPHNINASTFWVSGILPCIPLLGMLHWHCYYRGWFPSPHSQTD